MGTLSQCICDAGNRIRPGECTWRHWRGREYQAAAGEYQAPCLMRLILQLPAVVALLMVPLAGRAQSPAHLPVAAVPQTRPLAGHSGGRMIPLPLPRLAERNEVAAGTRRWPEDPAVGGLLGGVVGCAAGYAVFFVAAAQGQRSNSGGWGCIIGAVIGMGAGSRQIRG